MSGKHTGKVLALAIVAGLPSLAIADGPRAHDGFWSG